MLLSDATERYLYDVTHQCYIDENTIKDCKPQLIVPIIDEYDLLESNYCLAVLDNDHFARGYDNNHGIKIWNLITNKFERQISGLMSVDALVALNSNYLLCYSANTHCMYIYDWHTGNPQAIIACNDSTICTFSRKNLLPFDNGRYVLTSCNNCTISLWDLQDRRIIKSFEGHFKKVTCLEFGTNDSFFSGSLDTTISRWNITTGKRDMVLTGHKRYVLSLTLVDQNTLASSSGDMHIRIWSLRDGTCTAILRGHKDIIRNIITLGSNLLCSASDDHNIKIWNVLSHKLITTLQQGHTGSVFEVVSACRGTKLISTSFDRTMRIWNLRSDTISVKRMFDRLKSSLHVKYFVDIMITTD
jgi:WD40 repeat protein